MRKASLLGSAALVSLLTLGTVTVGSAQSADRTFEGCGLVCGVRHALNIDGIAHSSDIRELAMNILSSVLGFLSLISVIVVIIAGFYLVLSFGSDDGKDKAKKTIYYTLIGLAVILFARVIVGFITAYLARTVQ